MQIFCNISYVPISRVCLDKWHIRTKLDYTSIFFLTDKPYFNRKQFLKNLRNGATKRIVQHHNTNGRDGSWGTKPSDCKTTWHACAFPNFLLFEGIIGRYSTPLTIAFNFIPYLSMQRIKNKRKCLLSTKIYDYSTDHFQRKRTGARTISFSNKAPSAMIPDAYL